MLLGYSGEFFAFKGSQIVIGKIKIKNLQRETLFLLNDLGAFAKNHTKNRMEAKDLVQDARLRAFSFYGRFEEGTNCKAWLFTLMKNIFINPLKKLEKEILIDYFSHDALNMNPEEQDMIKQDLERALHAVPRKWGGLIILKDIKGHTSQEFSVLMDCPKGTVHSRMSRCRKSLRKILQAYEPPRLSNNREDKFSNRRAPR